MATLTPQTAPFWGILTKIPQNNHKQSKIQTNSFKKMKVWTLRTISFLYYYVGGQIFFSLWPKRYAGGEGVWGGKNPVWAPRVTQQNTLFCIQSWRKPTEISLLYCRNVFNEDKPETIHSVKYFYTLCGLMKFKLHLCLDATILFWRKCASWDENNVTKPAQFISSLIQGKEHKGNRQTFVYGLICVTCFSHVVM